MANNTMSNATDEYVYSDEYGVYSLPSDNSHFIQGSIGIDITTLNPQYFAPGLSSICFGALIIVHSVSINRKKMNHVRVCSEVAALSMIIYAVLVYAATTHPNRTKGVLCIDVFGTGVFEALIQLCDAYIFYNRLKAVQTISKWKTYLTYFYIYGIVIIPYSSTYLWVPIFYNLNADNYIMITVMTAQNAWSVVAYNTYFTSEFIYILFKIYGSKDRHSGGVTSIQIYLVSIKTILHFFVSTTANLLYVYYTIFLPDTLTFSFYFNMGICFGIHFFFNYKTDQYIIAITGFFFPGLLLALPADTGLTKTSAILAKVKNVSNISGSTRVGSVSNKVRPNSSIVVPYSAEFK